MAEYLDVLQKYFVFSGRARRKEYWMFCLVNVVVSFILGIIGGILGAMLGVPGLPHLIGNIYAIAILIPAISVGVRRLHDTGHNGWWMFLIFINIIFFVRPGTPGPNKYGSDPQEPAANNPVA